MMVLLHSSLLEFSCIVFRSLFAEIKFFRQRFFANIKKFFVDAWRRWLITYSKSPRSRRYGSLEEEAIYWREAERLQHIFAPWDARAGTSIESLEGGRQIVYYTPRLPPVYREKRNQSKEAFQYHLPAREFLRWHWSVFPEMVSKLIPKRMAIPHPVRTIPVIKKLRRSSAIIAMGTLQKYIRCRNRYVAQKQLGEVGRYPNLKTSFYQAKAIPSSCGATEKDIERNGWNI